ncbi:type II toxin-antitoxin system PemK/MazF family toxin [Brevundimonas aurifodinae]|uniref:Type II toxin-antitoxin system PemK/MazF family toxin n=2 Tax=Brevundimonas TaxID=41275 RepID=A0ABV1NPF2_9CAUL|nr:MAG: hypothetical protein B7Z42_03580 [Brevundimonas sp. 12-68-7]OYX35949.1 MAG: hypothetical protein B7Z01_01150 [Brevundimonas subvibrioides]
MISEFGDVVVVDFPFTDQSAAKRRPAVVISAANYNRQRPDVILLAITSKIDRALMEGDVLISDWRTAGLLKPSAFKLVIGTFSKASITGRLGHLGDADRTVLNQTVFQLLGNISQA